MALLKLKDRSDCVKGRNVTGFKKGDFQRLQRELNVT